MQRTNAASRATTAQYTNEAPERKEKQHACTWQQTEVPKQQSEAYVTDQI
jgi:hypothetical protein